MMKRFMLGEGVRGRMLLSRMSILKKTVWALELKEIVYLFYQALYVNAADISWQHKFNNTIAGLRDLCVESGMIA